MHVGSGVKARHHRRPPRAGFLLAASAVVFIKMTQTRSSPWSLTLSSGLSFASWQRDQHEQRGQSSHARPRLGNAPGTPDQDADCHCWTRTESLACCRQADWKLSCVGKAVQTYNSVSSAPHPSFNVTKRPRARRHMRRHPRPRPMSMSRCATGRGVEEVEEKEPGACCCWPTTVTAVVPLTTGAAAPRAAHYIHVHVNVRVHVHVQMCHRCRGLRR